MLDNKETKIIKVFIYIVCVILTVLSILPFWIMIVNATRSTTQIQQHAVAFIPSTYMMNNFKILTGKSFNPMVGFKNSLIVSTFATLCATYFSTLTAYAVVVYDWKLKNAFFSFVMAVMMIPAQVTMIGFYQMADKLGVDLDDIINAKIDQNEKKYPVEKAKGSAKKYNEL